MNPESQPTHRLSVSAQIAGFARIGLFAGVLAWLAPRASRAENSASYKYEDYRESGDRIAVKTQGAYLEQDLGHDTRVTVQGVLDSIAGATPTGERAPAGSDQVVLSEMHDKRKAWNADISHQFKRVNLSFGFGNSRESDYVSDGWSVNTVTDFNQKNTQLIAGLAGTDDKIKVYWSSRAPRQRKHTNDVILGVSQLLDPETQVTFNVTWGMQRGYLADPYKLVEKTIEVFPGVFLSETFGENRPMYREKWVALAALNHAFPGLHAAIDATYRYYHDTYGTNAHLLDLSWFQHVTDTVILRPNVRLYDQNAAWFYHYNLDTTNIVPVDIGAEPKGPFYSSDHRLSALRTYTYGLKVIWNVTTALSLDLAVERYDMRGRDGVTPKSAYPKARVITAGIKYAW